MRAWKRISGPDGVPVTVDDMKSHLGIQHDALNRRIDDALLEAVEYVEGRLGQSLMPQVWDYYIDEFRRLIELPRPPLQAVTYVKYWDIAGVLQTVIASLYDVDTVSDVGRVCLKRDAVWPQTQVRQHAIQIRSACGYADAESVPAVAKRAIKMLVGHWIDVAPNAVVVGTISKEFEFSVNALLDTLPQVRPLEPCDA